MMNEHVELIGLIDNPAARRLWLIYNALQSLPFDRAIELAHTAEAFVTDSPTDRRISDARVLPGPPGSEGLASTEPLVNEMSSSVRPNREPMAKKRTRLALPAEQRDRLLKRLAGGAKNAELATEFGLSLQQVQGLRIGCARELTKRRDQLSRKATHPGQTPPHTTWTEDIVRYLRQQDNVVVPQENGEFLVNGRFQMSAAELIARANRMRARQRQPEFELIGDKAVGPEKISSANGHPLFWKESADAQPRS